MDHLAFNYYRVSVLRPCSNRFRAAVARLGGAAAWKSRPVSFAEMRDAGVKFEDLIWLAASACRRDRDIDRRLRLWMADCAARVMHVFDRDRPGDHRVRNAIIAARAFARGEITSDASDAASAAAMAAAEVTDKVAAWEAALAAALAATKITKEITPMDAAWAAEAAAEGAERAEEQWQFDRLVARMSDPEPDDWPLTSQSDPADAR